jgi:hypothetical protein
LPPGASGSLLKNLDSTEELFCRELGLDKMNFAFRQQANSSDAGGGVLLRRLFPPGTRRAPLV